MKNQKMLQHFWFSWQTQINNAQIQLNDLDAELKLNDEYMDEARNSADGCATSIDRFGDRVKASAEKADTLRDALSAAGVIAALKATADAMEACVDSSIEFESAMAGVAKTTDLTEVELSDMADAIQELSTRIPATTTEIANVVEAAGQLGIAKDDLLAFSEVMVNLATTVAAIETNLDEAVQQLEEKAAAVDFSGFSEALNSAFENVGANFQSIGIDCGTGLAQGLNDSQGQVREAGVAVGDAAEDGTRDGVESHSPSQAFFRIGEDCDSGLEQGIKSKIPNILATAKDMGQQLTTRMKESGKQAVEGYDREFSQISAKSASACRSMVSSASSAASGLPGAMTDIGVQSVNGMIQKRGFYQSRAWRRVRLMALQRDHYLCQDCLKKKRIRTATEVHHIQPFEEYPELGLELSNLRSLSQAINSTKITLSTFGAENPYMDLCTNIIWWNFRRK